MTKKQKFEVTEQAQLEGCAEHFMDLKNRIEMQLVETLTKDELLEYLNRFESEIYNNLPNLELIKEDEETVDELTEEVGNLKKELEELDRKNAKLMARIEELESND